MTRHFGVLIPSTNTTGEREYRTLPEEWQAHYGRLATSTPGMPFGPSQDSDIDYQAKLLGTAKVETLFLLQTSASLFADDYCAKTSRRMSDAAGAPAFTSAMAIGEAMQSLGVKRIALVSPYSPEVNQRARNYFESKYGLSVAGIEGFAATDSYLIGQLGPEMARDAFARIDKPEIEAFVVPGGNFPTMASIPGWEAEFNKPVVTTNQAAFWGVTRRLGVTAPIPGCGRLLQ